MHIPCIDTSLHPNQCLQVVAQTSNSVLRTASLDRRNRETGNAWEKGEDEQERPCVRTEPRSVCWSLSS